MKKLRKVLIYLLLRLLERELTTLPLRPSLNKETRRTLLARAYQNPALMEYFEIREQALVRNTFALFVSNKIDDARGLAGQVYELQTLRNTLRVCYNYKKEERNSSLKDLSTLRGQTHDGSSDEG